MRKIDQKTNFISRGLEVIEQLGFMNLLQRINRFDFQDDLVFNDDICTILPDFLLLVFNLDWLGIIVCFSIPF